MSSQIGIPSYKDELNNVKLKELKDYINALCLDYAKLSTTKAIENRESDAYEEYVSQYQQDVVILKDISFLSQKIQNTTNNVLFMISTRSLYNHLS